jgi:hypothetical protein
MVRNKSQSQEGLNDNRRGRKGDNRQNNNDLLNRESLLHDDDFRENSKKGNKNSQNRKGSPGRK